jgi:hypothetical protein
MPEEGRDIVSVNIYVSGLHADLEPRERDAF